MSFVTQCPQCSTHFKLVPDQLRISDGWVRCGQCGEVFDARERMQPWVPPTAGAAATPPGPATQQPANPPVNPPAAQSAPAVEPLAPISETPPSDISQTQGTNGSLPDDPLPEIDFAPDPGPGHHAEPASVPASAVAEVAGEPPSPVEMPAALLEAQAPSAPTALADDAVEQADSIQALLMPGGFPASDRMPLEKASAPNRIRKPKGKRKDPLPPDPEDVSFVRQAKRQAFWRRPLVRATLWLLAVGLGVALVAQAALQQRDRLVAAYPSLKPWAEQACQPIGCEVRPLQQLESVLIDSSAMVRLGDGAFRFEVVLKNTSELMLAVPALELSLTNSRDEAVVRRVVLPTDWSAPPDELPPLSELPLSVRITLVDGPELRMAGYRAVVFYP